MFIKKLILILSFRFVKWGLKKQIKNRNETIPMYEKAGRTETAEKEKKEVDFIQLLMKEYFPNEISN